MSKHLGCKKQLEIEEQNNMTIPEWLFKEPTENQPRKI